MTRPGKHPDIYHPDGKYHHWLYGESIIFTRYGIFIGYQWRLPSGKQPHNELENTHFLWGKSTINSQFSITMLNYQRVNVCIKTRHGMPWPKVLLGICSTKLFWDHLPRFSTQMLLFSCWKTWFDVFADGSFFQWIGQIGRLEKCFQWIFPSFSNHWIKPLENHFPIIFPSFSNGRFR